MTRIRAVRIDNFRGIRRLTWYPSSGINCLIGPGDSGKSSILDAIDLCLGAWRSASFGDTDFYNLGVDQPVVIAVTLGALPHSLPNPDGYGDYLRRFNAATDRVA